MLDGFGQPPVPEQPQGDAPQIFNPYAGTSGLAQDPFGDDGTAAAPPEQPAEQPQPDPYTAPPSPAPIPLANPDFDPEMAIAPVVGAAPGIPDAPPAEGEEQDERQAPAAPVPPPLPQPQQGGVPVADELVRKNQHGDPLLRRVGRGMRKAVGASGATGIKTQAELVEMLQRPVAGYRQLAVASVRGGAGKTSMAALVATELARHRADRVLAVDADAELGSLPLRLGVRTELSLFDLAGRQPRTFEEAAQFLARTESGLWALSSTRGGRIAGEFTVDTFQSALSALTRYFAAVIVDCGAGILTELHRGILAHTHGLVLVTPGTVDGALSARGALEWFAGNGQQALIARTVIAMVSHAPQAGADLDRARQMLTEWGVPVVHVPYDRHLATGGALDLSKVGADTGTAVGRIAAEVFARSIGMVQGGAR
ncbi:hypothetical protein ACIBF1_04405 [Spirillospora sp. NPDC050679]